MRSRWATRNRRKCRKCLPARAESDPEPVRAPLRRPAPKTHPIDLQKPKHATIFAPVKITQGTFADPRNLSRGKAFPRHPGGRFGARNRLFLAQTPFRAPDPPSSGNAGRSGLQRGRGWRSTPCSAPAASRSSSPCPCRACREVEGGSAGRTAKLGDPPPPVGLPGGPPATKASGAPPEFCAPLEICV